MEKTRTVSEKDKSNHGLSSVDIFKVLGSFALILGITFNIIYRNNSERKITLAKNNAKSYAEKLVSTAVNSTHVRNLRQPASDEEGGEKDSAGKMGLDPWGVPFLYKVIQNSYGQPVYMVVLSSGPNKSLDTRLENISAELRSKDQVKIMGDDIGYLKSFR